MTPDLREQNGDYDQYVRVGDRIVAKAHLHFYNDTPAAVAVGSSHAAFVVGRALASLLLVAVGLLALVAFMRRPRGPRWRPVLASALIGALLLPACGGAVTGTESPSLWRPASITYFHTGFAAGPVLLTDEKAAVIDERRSEPFGLPIDSFREPSTFLQTIDYALEPTNILNKPTDPRTGWSYHGARWMAPQTGRWLTPDPPVKAPDAKFMSAPWKLHPYQYGGQNSISFWDPDGADDDRIGDLKYFGVRRPETYAEWQGNIGTRYASMRTPFVDMGAPVLAIAVGNMVPFVADAMPALFPLTCKAMIVHGVLTAKTEGEAMFAVTSGLSELRGLGQMLGLEEAFRPAARGAATLRPFLEDYRLVWGAGPNLRTSVIDILRPYNRLIGGPGSTPAIRIVKGGEREASELFAGLTEGGTPILGTKYPGTRVQVPEGTIGLRMRSSSGPPTIDVDIEGLGIDKIKFIDDAHR